MRNMKQLALVGLFVVFASAAMLASSPIQVTVRQYQPLLPLDSKIANKVVRVVYEHHKNNRRLEVGCEGTIFVASWRDVVGKDKEGIAEELFPFSLLGGSYICEAVLFRGDGNVFRKKTGEFVVM